MVKLIGVHHGGYEISLVTGRGEFPVRPSEELLKWLSGFPTGTRIGLESLTFGNFEEVKVDLARRSLSMLNDEDEREYVTGYGSETERYWDFLRDFCMARGMNVVFLESKEAYFRCNQISIALQKQKARLRKLFKEEGESEIDYLKKLLNLNDDRYVAEINFREVHEIDREREILKAITETNVDVAILGNGHAAIFADELAEPRKGKPKTIEEYHTDLLVPAEEGYQMTFTRDVEPALSEIVARKCLEGAISLTRTGRITPRLTPTYVGVWDNAEPFVGYFELFEEGNDSFSGFIHDSIGPASFNGEVTDKEISFVKRYMHQPRRRPITYKGFKVGEDFFGYYCVGDSGGSAFCMTKSQKEKPIDLCLRLELAGETRQEDFQRIARTFQQTA